MGDGKTRASKAARDGTPALRNSPKGRAVGGHGGHTSLQQGTRPCPRATLQGSAQAVHSVVSKSDGTDLCFLL